ncbi:MAG: ABC transporter permease [Candidatus Marinimicrobia bacterium]|nr:ABC transporter permease [Candidatus Neomarinimicrobiota bacterium]
MIYKLLKIEIFKTFSKWRSYISFLIFAFFVPLILISAHYSGGLGNSMIPAAQEHFLFTGNLYNGYFLAYFVLNLLFFHLPFLVTVAAGDLFAGESAEGTYRFLLVRPISRSSFFISKWLTNLIYTFSLLLFLGGLTLILGLILEGSGDLLVLSADFGIVVIDEKVAIWKILGAYSIGALNLLTVSTMALLFSIFVSNAVGPIIATMGIMIIFYFIELIDIGLFEQIRPFLFTHYMDSWQFFFFDDMAYEGLIPALLVHLFYISIFTLISYIYFMRKEIHS